MRKFFCLSSSSTDSPLNSLIAVTIDLTVLSANPAGATENIWFAVSNDSAADRVASGICLNSSQSNTDPTFPVTGSKQWIYVLDS